MEALGDQTASGQLGPDCLVKRRRLEGAQEESNGQLVYQEHGQSLQPCSSEERLLLRCVGSHLPSPPNTAQKYKGLLHGHLESLNQKWHKLLEQRQAQEQSWQKCQEQFAIEKVKVFLLLEPLQELLRQRQQLWLAWLDKQEKEMEAEWGVALAQLSREASRLQQLMAQTERKCSQPDREFLQDIQDTVDRCRSYLVGRSGSASPRLQGRVRTLLGKNASVRRIVHSYKATLQRTLSRKHLDRLLGTAPAPEKPGSPKAVHVTLNRSTAHPRLRCQRSRVTWARRYQECPDVPERFNWEFCVLGCERFTTGWFWWEVSILEANHVPVWGRTCWAIGVAKESIRRKGSFQLSPREGIWAVGKSFWGETVAFSEVQEKLGLQRPLQTLQVRLDYEAGKVGFLDGETEDSLYTFRMGPLHGETLRPFFYLGQKGVTLQCEEFPRPTEKPWGW